MGHSAIELEAARHVRQLARLVLQRAGGGGGFFNQRGILLGHAVELDHGLVDLADAGGRLAAGGAGLRILSVRSATTLQGGVPIVVDGKIIGAIGVSGVQASQDEQVAMAGAAALAAK